MTASARRWMVAVLAGASVACACPGVATAAAPRARVGSAPRMPDATRVTGRVTATRSLALTVSLASRDPLGMQRLAEAVSTPGSAQYRRYLTVGQFAERFGATPAHVRAVAAALRRAGLRVAPVAADRLELSVRGTAAAVQDAFATRLDSVRLADGTRAFVDRTAPTLPASIAGDVESVVGLSTLARPEAGALPDSGARAVDGLGPARPDVATGGPQPCAAAVGAAGRLGGYTADVIQAAYDFPGLYAAGAEGQGQTVAVFELEKVRHADIAAYQRCYGTHARLSYVDVDHPEFAGDDAESGLDIEQIIGLAPRAHVIVYQAADTNEAGVADYAKIVSQDRAKTISVSWGACERKITAGGSDLSVVRAENRLFQEAALQGQSILSASGDTGSAGCVRDLNSRALAVQDPSSQPFATAIGGTTLYSDVNGMLGLWNPTVPLLESVWNDGVVRTSVGKLAEGTGGGLSRLWAMPAYQRRAAASLGVTGADSSGTPCRSSHGCREVPDVSADGDPQSGYVVYVSAPNRQWTVEGGTSAAAPLWAALTADADSLASCRGASLGFEDPSLYALASLQPGDFRDISSASPFTGRADNDATNSNRGLFPVGAGYDMTTGLGVPNAAALASGLCALRAPVYAVALTPPRVRSAVVRSRVRLFVHGTDSGKLRLRYTARGLPRGVRITRSGEITGRPRHPGRYRVTVTAVDHATNRSSVSFRLVVLTPAARVSDARLSGVARRRPQLAVTATRGVRGPDLRAVTIRLPRGLTVGRSNRGISVSGRVGVQVSRLRDGVTLRLRRAVRSVRVTLRGPSLLASRGLAITARRHPSVRVRVRVAVTDRTHRVTDRGVRLKAA